MLLLKINVYMILKKTIENISIQKRKRYTLGGKYLLSDLKVMAVKGKKFINVFKRDFGKIFNVFILVSINNEIMGN